MNRYGPSFPFSDLARRALRNMRPDPLANDPLFGYEAQARREPDPLRIDHLLAIGLGRPGGPMGLAVLERTAARPATYACVHLKRFPSGTTYDAVVEYAAEKTGAPPLVGCRLILDAGHGPAVVAIFRRGRGTAQLFPVLPTTDNAVVEGPDGTLRVPGAFVASDALAVLQQSRLRVAGSLTERQRLHAGLKTLGGRAGLLTQLNALVWLTGEDDPLVQAVALGLWHGENRMCRLAGAWGG